MAAEQVKGRLGRLMFVAVAVTCVCAAWAVFEFAANSPFWGMIALGFTAYAVWQFFYLYRAPGSPAGQDGKE